ncbi:MAG: beta-methylarginine biosynthesis bifunctional aminotransferase [Geminicoccaceae bacterium]
MPSIISSCSPYSSLHQRHAFARSHGLDPLVISENVPQWPDGPPMMAATSAASVNAYANCNGIEDLRVGIADRENRLYGSSLTSANVVVTNGALQGLGLILRHIHRSGAHILVQAPVLGSVGRLLKSTGYRMSFFTLGDGAIDLEKLSLLCNNATEAIYLNLPNNPNGAVADSGSMNDVLAFAQQRGLKVIADTVYDGYTFVSDAACSPLPYVESLKNIYIVNSMSKNYGAPGIRVGWILADRQETIELGGRLQFECLAVAGDAQEQAVQLLHTDTTPLLHRVKAGRSLVIDALSQIPNITYRAPAGGTQVFAGLPVDDVEAFADMMLLTFGLMVATSDHFLAAPGAHIRIPLGLPKRQIAKGLQILEEGLEAWQTDQCFDVGTPAFAHASQRQ